MEGLRFDEATQSYVCLGCGHFIMTKEYVEELFKEWKTFSKVGICNHCGHKFYITKEKEKEEIGVSEGNKFNKMLAARIREIGETLIKNADSIAGTEKCITSLDIYIKVYDESDTIVGPEISIDKKLLPEKR